jgi:hypothetical protein
VYAVQPVVALALPILLSVIQYVKLSLAEVIRTSLRLPLAGKRSDYFIEVRAPALLTR